MIPGYCDSLLRKFDPNQDYLWMCESPSLVLDNWWNLCTNLCYELWYELGWCNPSCEVWWHSNGDVDHMKWWDGHMWWWSSAQHGKGEREKQNPMEIKAKV